MPHTDSAKKNVRKSSRQRAANLFHLKRVRETIKLARSLVAAKKISEAEKILPRLYKLVDKAAKHGVIKTNAASRYKSRLTKFIHRKPAAVLVKKA